MVFADTFYFLAILNRQDSAHQRALALATALTEPILTTTWVLTEVADAMAARGLRKTFIRLFETLEADPNCTIVSSNDSLFRSGIKLYADRPDKDWSLTDCVSLVVMQQHGANRALTGDRHFEQAGFMALLK